MPHTALDLARAQQRLAARGWADKGTAGRLATVWGLKNEKKITAKGSGVDHLARSISSVWGSRGDHELRRA